MLLSESFIGISKSDSVEITNEPSRLFSITNEKLSGCFANQRASLLSPTSGQRHSGTQDVST